MSYYAGVVSFKGEEMALAYLGEVDNGILAIGNSQNSVANAVLNNFSRFDISEIEDCLHSISKLEICEDSNDDAVVLNDFWAHAFIVTLVKQINGSGARISNVMNQIPNPFWVCLQATNTILYLAIQKDPKMLLVFSKQQAQLIFEEQDYKSDFEISVAFKDQIRSADLPEESDRTPLVCEGNIVELLISAFLTADTNALHPWKYNFQNN